MRWERNLKSVQTHILRNCFWEAPHHHFMFIRKYGGAFGSTSEQNRTQVPWWHADYLAFQKGTLLQASWNNKPQFSIALKKGTVLLCSAQPRVLMTVIIKCLTAETSQARSWYNFGVNQKLLSVELLHRWKVLDDPRLRNSIISEKQKILPWLWFIIDKMTADNKPNCHFLGTKWIKLCVCVCVCVENLAVYLSSSQGHRRMRENKGVTVTCE